MNAYHQYKLCIESCLSCAALCKSCAVSCAQEADAFKRAKCIQLNMECAVICYAAAELMTLGSERIKEICKMAADACDKCAEECSKFNDVVCKETAGYCTKCADECEVVLN
jgi:hypothetical protein